MGEVTRLLSAIEQGDPQAASQLLPLVYDELRRTAHQNMRREAGGHTLAEVMGISSRTVKRHWKFARAWLLQEIEQIVKKS